MGQSNNRDSEAPASLSGCHESTKGRRREKGRARNELRHRVATPRTSFSFASSSFRVFVANSWCFTTRGPIMPPKSRHPSPFFPWHRIPSVARTTAMTRVALRLFSPMAHAAVWAPAVLLAAATILFWSTNLDQATVRLFFSGDTAAADIAARFPLGTQQPWKLLYDWGVYPALLIGCGGIVVWVVSFFWMKIESCATPVCSSRWCWSSGRASWSIAC